MAFIIFEKRPCMCGIVGYLGVNSPISIVLEGLSRLEYRGYDSAGISILDDHSTIHTYKKTGDISVLKTIVPKSVDKQLMAIGHTRWATHGQVTDFNAHPHVSEDFSCVHNGIIENFQDLKAELIGLGQKFDSETDSEVFVRLLEVFSLEEAYHKIKGNSAFVFIDADKKIMKAVKKSAPLVLGRSTKTNEFMVSSDPYALLGIVDEIIFPEDGVVCQISLEEGLNFYELDGSKSERYTVRTQDSSFTISTKDGHEHFMLKEIFEQPALIKNIFSHYKEPQMQEELKNFKESMGTGAIHISACGTAYYAGLVIKNYFEKFNRVPVHCDLASEFRYRNPILKNDDLALFISQSGETADTLAALDICKKSKLKNISILNVIGSTLGREVDFNFPIFAGKEIGVASTKAFTMMCVVGRVMSAFLESKEAFDALEKKLALLANRVEDLFSQRETLKDIAESIYSYKGYFFTGRGLQYPIALEGALKLKEIAYVHAEGYAAGELKHGPLALIDEEMVNIAIVTPELYEKTFSNLKEIKARKGKIVAIGPRGDKNLMSESDYYIPLDFEGLEEFSGLYVNIVNQLLSYYMAKFKGHDID
ncbi:glutamine--fructose-6-phosphate transaminase (isomerizing), partial [bacterium]|nr:glutamine--fructose-6-phosphate transaminase (isomerizing) [bacterium]